MNVSIDGAFIRSEADFHAVLAEELGLPSHYGRNLDAMWDVLSTDVERPVVLVWKNSRLSSDALGGKFAQIVGILERVKAQDAAWNLPERFDYFLE
ncbi:barstar family protein [Dyella japonica]|uniref:Ribonuclease inhibitor n=1 Tax=Dyella japonica TaxID=231455 RepID=A0ABV2JSH6_9GAMM